MKFGQRLRMEVAELDERGAGLGPATIPDDPAAAARPAAARFVIPDEIVEGAFAGRDGGQLRLSDVRVVKASPDRVEPPCPHAGTCGGCAWQHIAYPRQAELKLASVRRALSIADLPVEISRIVPADATLHHRNRMDYVFGPDGELGLKEPGRWDRPLDLETCLMLSEGGLETLRRVRAWAKGTPLKPWDNRRHQGYLRYLVIREGKNTGERMAMLVTAEGPLEDEAGLVEALAPLCSSIVHGINPSITDVSVAGMIRPLRGEALLHERVGGVRYRIHPNGFFQTNTAMAERLLEQVRASVAAGPHGRLLDLYCGSGFFALALASDVGEVLGVELDDKAIEDAHAAAADNGIGNARFRAEAAEALSWEDERPDVVVVDPPRSGLHPSVRRTLLERRPPRIVYVSCNPRALAADLAQLLEAYEADPAVCIDLFPHTPHVETVVGLRKR